MAANLDQPRLAAEFSRVMAGGAGAVRNPAVPWPFRGRWGPLLCYLCAVLLSALHATRPQPPVLPAVSPVSAFAVVAKIADAVAQSHAAFVAQGCALRLVCFVFVVCLLCSRAYCALPPVVAAACPRQAAERADGHGDRRAAARGLGPGVCARFRLHRAGPEKCVPLRPSLSRSRSLGLGL